MTIDTKPLSERLRIDAEEIAGWGAGNEAATVREAADALDAKDALLREAAELLAIFADYSVSSMGIDLDGYVIKLAVGGQQPMFNDFDRARTLLSKLTEATKP